MKKAYLLVASILLAACVSAQPQALQSYPDGFLCQLLDEDQYLSTPQEQINVFKELERRKVTCVERGAVGNQVVVINN